MGTPLRSIADLRISARRPNIASDDEVALFVLEEASGLVCDTAGHPEWEDDPGAAPRPARRICLAVATRTFLNPEFEVQSTMGPLSSRVLDLAALGLNLSDDERETLEGMRGSSGGNGLGILTLAGGQSFDRTLSVVDELDPYDLIPYFDTESSDAGVTDDDTIIPVIT